LQAMTLNAKDILGCMPMKKSRGMTK